MDLCQYKDFFGKPGEGLHSMRIGSFALVDIVATIIVAVIIKHFLPQINFWFILLVLFVSGIIAHRVFCVSTSFDKMIFG